ncbi:aldo/keto reductase [Niabella ginsengisoli]|uniref:Aldo/keto reductase n=1 Tax=Niabella ginsengisoli TaxID=522298 RepID=A0ABS9SMB0_9BACT|nr:aldo/keto reductase [Niabella ginsengisoli]MCH5599518.1 aldo/keto reductase [Niabella ginsengisoli]
MKYNVIGLSELKVSEIGFGCMSLSKASLTDAATMIKSAVDVGINFFDTADLYDKGANEELVGTVLKPVRNNILLATKVGNEWRRDGSGWDWNPKKAYIVKAVEDSLRRLQTDYIDLYQLHGGTIEDAMEDTIEAFEELVRQGKIRYYGISSIRPNVIRKYVELSSIQSVMMQYSLLDRRPEEEMITYLEENHKSILVRGALAQGLLVNKPAKDYLGYGEDEVSLLQDHLAQNSEKETRRIAIALQYVLGKPVVASAVIGFRTVEQLKEVLQNDTDTIDQQALEDAHKVLVPKKYEAHR